MRIVFMGTAEFAVPSLKMLVQAGHEIISVVTQPDRPKGRGQQIRFSPVKEAALALNLPVFQSLNIKEQESIDYLQGLEAELFVVVAYGQILSRKVLDLPKKGCINVHASLLPKYRGAAPIHWAIINGESETGVTIMYMEEALDSGDIIEQREVKIEPHYNVGILHDILADLGAKALISSLADLASNRIKPILQDDSLATYAPQLKKEDEIICWEKTNQEVVNHIRGMNPWPGTYTICNGQILKIIDAEIVNASQVSRPGTITKIDKKGIYVQCGEGSVLLKLVKPQGKREMTADAFCRGHNDVKPGLVFDE